MSFHASTAERVPQQAAHTRGTLARLIGIAVLAVLALFWSAQPAHAHDELVGTEFELSDDGAVESIVLSFSAVILDVGTEIQVTDPDGTDATDGEPVQAGRDVTQALQPDLAEGTYDVVWRVVSSDGHPIDGAFSFEVSSEPGFEPSVLPFSQDDAAAEAEHEHDHEHEHGTEDSEASDASEALDMEPESTDTEALDAAADESGFPVGLTVALIAAALIVIGVIIFVVRRRSTRTQPDEQGAAPEPRS